MKYGSYLLLKFIIYYIGASIVVHSDLFNELVLIIVLLLLLVFGRD